MSGDYIFGVTTGNRKTEPVYKTSPRVLVGESGEEVLSESSRLET